ncbi:hypothetical protein NC99_22120 [Sunxiuqinia dokdonensis]|uniref:Uncharacterized protein n=1 Tax=Sunxiuqinia dokdonensis TaxID=1409788 RepID=A0A0L8VA63_9BACT|nr:hypothetical protein NC99_22120 [Sunxiuqinia dokdonensis]
MLFSVIIVFLFSVWLSAIKIDEFPGCFRNFFDKRQNFPCQWSISDLQLFSEKIRTVNS